ncbi:MAG: glycosyltransferase family 39 protein [Planctomycetaceae bacterium]|jgi:hypothetical protein|nr:glycosyltransferase family 39 protein [Planctomycetaceae bacterium]
MLPRQASLIFFFVALIYGVAWTVIPFMSESNFRYDTIEMFLIGKEGVIATFKHPALNSIILEFVYQRLSRSDIAPYLLNQVFFFLTALAIWRIGREFFTPFESLVGVLTFYGYWAYFYASLNYNHNVILTTEWGFVTLFALLAIKYNRYRDWVGLGVVIGLGFYCKVTIIFLVFAILIFTLLNSTTRKYWSRAGVYLATIIALVIASPMLYWIFVSGFSFLNFPLQNRIEGTLANRLFIFLNVAAIVPLLCLSFIVLLLPLLSFKFKFKEKTEMDGDRILARNFLISTNFIAWFCMLLSCIVSAANRDMYDFTQIFIFTGLILVVVFKTAATPKAIRLFFIFFVLTMIFYPVGYSAHLYNAYNIRRHGRTWYLFPGKELAVKVEDVWRNKYDKPLKYITGEWPLAGSAAIYSKDRPTCHCDYYGFPLTTWSTDKDVLKTGGIAIWLIGDGKQQAVPHWLKKKFPSAELLEPIELQKKTKASREPYRIGLAIIPPDDSIKLEPLTPAPIRLWTN